MLSQPRLYFDHAATSYPKPIGVRESLLHYWDHIAASAGRGAYQEAWLAKDILDQTRKQLALLFQTGDPNRFIFTLNATEALNLGLKGVVKPGGHVITSSLEHNSIARQLLVLKENQGVSFSKIDIESDGTLDWNKFKALFRPNTQLVALIHASNVSGTRLPIEEIAIHTQKQNIPLLVDAAQTAGSYPIFPEKIGIDLLAFPGHKGLLGPLGTGGLWVRPGLEIETLKQGGTGSFSEDDHQPLFWPDRHESGSHNLLGIAGLNAALEFLLHEGVEKIYKHKMELTAHFLEGVKKIQGVFVMGPKEATCNAGVVSLCFEGKNPQNIASRLDQEFRIQVRPGLHCAPWAHRQFGSYPDGTVRFSFGYSNELEEVDKALKAIQALV